MNEQWRPVSGFEGAYDVSNQGRVRSIARVSEGRPRVVAGRILRATRTDEGYERVTLFRGRHRFTKRVHRLVLEAFVGPCPDGMEACHNDGDPTRSVLENLRWDTQSENTFDRVRHGTHPMARRETCPRGHRYSRTDSRGWRVCDACKNERRRAA